MRLLKITLSLSDWTGRVGELSPAKPPLCAPPQMDSEGADIDKQADRNQCHPLTPPCSLTARQTRHAEGKLWLRKKKRDKHLINIHQSVEHLLFWPSLRVGVRRKGFILSRFYE